MAKVINTISTHSLTKRLTEYLFRCIPGFFHFNSQPHEEADLNAGDPNKVKIVFQLTASRRGWPIMKYYQLSSEDISTHSLTKRLTARKIFWEITGADFNSQPHEEADTVTGLTADSGWVFQLTASRRGWRHRRCTVKLYGTISTHSLTKRLTSLT